MEENVGFLLRPRNDGAEESGREGFDWAFFGFTCLQGKAHISISWAEAQSVIWAQIAFGVPLNILACIDFEFSAKTLNFATQIKKFVI